MDSSPGSPPAPAALSASRFSVAAGSAAAAIGALALTGWILGVESLKTIYGPITMKTNAAIGLLACGLGVAWLRRSPGASAWCGLAASAIGGLTLAEHLSGWDAGIDQLLFSEPAGAAATASPNRMGPNASTSFILAGTSLWLLARNRHPRAAHAAQAMSLLALTMAAVPLAGYLYGAEQLYGIARYTGIALHTAIAFVFLHVGMLTARPGSGPMAFLLSEGLAGTVLRRLAVPVVTIPLALGYLEVYARTAGHVDRGLGVALYAIALIVVLGATVWHTAKAVDRSDLARRVAERDRDLLMLKERQARAEAERASHLKDRFLATLSHELRTPLNVMLGWAQILEQNAMPTDRPRIASLVARNGRLLARLVEDLLDVSRVTTGQLDISPTPTLLGAIVQGSLDAIAPSAEEKGITLSAEIAPDSESIDADPQRLQQIIWNLLSNAVKFTPPGGRIIARTSFSREEAVLTIVDTGIGFDEAFAPELFTPFRQADPSASREHGGLGLGLSIARHLAERHGGSLTGMSAGPGRGATFTLRLPRVAARGAERRVEERQVAQNVG